MKEKASSSGTADAILIPRRKNKMRNSIQKILLIAFLMSQAIPARADSDQTFQFFQEEAKVVIATQREQTTEEAPSIVSVITRTDIERYGARDLADVLRMVPDFD